METEGPRCLSTPAWLPLGVSGQLSEPRSWKNDMITYKSFSVMSEFVSARVWLSSALLVSTR